MLLLDLLLYIALSSAMNRGTVNQILPAEQQLDGENSASDQNPIVYLPPPTKAMEQFGSHAVCRIAINDIVNANPTYCPGLARDDDVIGAVHSFNVKECEAEEDCDVYFRCYVTATEYRGCSRQFLQDGFAAMGPLMLKCPKNRPIRIEHAKSPKRSYARCLSKAQTATIQKAHDDFVERTKKRERRELEKMVQDIDLSEPVDELTHTEGLIVDILMDVGPFTCTDHQHAAGRS